MCHTDGPSKGSWAGSAESQTLTVGVCGKVRVYVRAPSKGVRDKHPTRFS